MRHGPRESVLYVTCVSCSGDEPDILATVDVDPESPTYGQIIHRLAMPTVGDELHHSGWNACISCKGRSRSHLILPCLQSDRIYIVDTLTDPKKPRLHKTVEGGVLRDLGLSAPHTSHCLPSGDILISCMGDAEGKQQGGFLLLGPDFSPKGRWEKKPANFGYDFWYQPRMGVLVSSAWGAPSAFRRGFSLEDVKEGRYGDQITVWEWGTGWPLQNLQLGPMPLEVRFLHNPTRPVGFVGCALDATVYNFHRSDPENQWEADKVISIQPIKVENWMLPEMPVSHISEFPVHGYRSGSRHRTTEQSLTCAASPAHHVEEDFWAGNLLMVVVSCPLHGKGECHCPVSQPHYRIPCSRLPERLGAHDTVLLSSLITDILISLDDRYLYLSNWTHGEVLRYDISDPGNPREAGRVLLGGLLCREGSVTTPGRDQPERPVVKGRPLRGGPQMLQLSLDGKRLYVTDSLFKPWDSQFYPDVVKHGSVMVRVNMDDNGLTLDSDFLVEFGDFLAHEMRYPGGDCTSDIWV
ncbi:SELENBP1 [Cordylochernes scorpioides]|uniref:SELENBP1 n=1 Tax=Cordylochernes scorpioides TaxID=51811 RepID=A0ABY6KSD0_9ARAC|nr:SELENBP1 [Cordylochernes scorpioides]